MHGKSVSLSDIIEIKALNPQDKIVVVFPKKSKVIFALK